MTKPAPDAEDLLVTEPDLPVTEPDAAGITPGPTEDPNAVPVPAPAAPPPPPVPDIEYHAETDTVFLHYRQPDMDAVTVTRLAHTAGADVIGAPDNLGLADGTDHWSIQIRNTKEN